MIDVEITRPEITGHDMGLTDHRSDWVYRDLPQMLDIYFDLFLNIVGEENISWLTRAEYNDKGQIYRRGQLLVSREGLARANRYAQDKMNAATTE